MTMKLKVCQFICILFLMLSVSCIGIFGYDEKTYEQTLTGSWEKGGNRLSIDADSSYLAYCQGYCWARDGKEDTYSIIQDSLITFDYDGIYRFKISSTGAELRFYVYTSLLQVRDDFLVGVWDRISE